MGMQCSVCNDNGLCGLAQMGVWGCRVGGVGRCGGSGEGVGLLDLDLDLDLDGDGEGRRAVLVLIPILPT